MVSLDGTEGSRNKEFKKKKSVKKDGGKVKDDIPSWAEGERPYRTESGNDFAARLLNKKYGSGNYRTGPRTEYNKLRKYADTHFE